MDYNEFKKKRGMIDRAEGEKPPAATETEAVEQPRRGRPPKEQPEPVKEPEKPKE
jgi:hypothetical protein